MCQTEGSLKLLAQQDTQSQKIRWRVTKKDTQHGALPSTCTHEYEHVHTHTNKEQIPTVV